jgi:hypothetical protein
MSDAYPAAAVVYSAGPAHGSGSGDGARLDREQDQAMAEAAARRMDDSYRERTAICRDALEMARIEYIYGRDSQQFRDCPARQRIAERLGNLPGYPFGGKELGEISTAMTEARAAVLTAVAAAQAGDLQPEAGA